MAVDADLFRAMLRADQLGIRLEIVGGLPIWEAHPVLKHQRAVDRIRGSIRLAQGQVHFAGVYVEFPDGSLKRPDVSIFCREPDEQDEAIRLVPEAVIEVISRGFEAKDLEIGPNFYLAQGVKDVVVLDPDTLYVLHATRGGSQRLLSPVTLALSCGCTCTV